MTFAKFLWELLEVILKMILRLSSFMGDNLKELRGDLKKDGIKN